jgi:hypothetical protein
MDPVAKLLIRMAVWGIISLMAFYPVVLILNPDIVSQILMGLGASLFGAWIAIETSPPL